MKKFFGQTGIFALPVLLLALGASTTSVAASNESDAAKIKRATRAAPRSITDEATIMDADGTILRQGSNEWTCFPGVPLIPGDRHPMCNDPVWMEWLFALSMGENPPTPDTIGVSYMLLGDALVNNADPAATDPDDGGPWIQEGPHLMLLFPNKASYDLYPTDPHAGGPYVMWYGTGLDHVMVPVK